MTILRFMAAAAAIAGVAAPAAAQTSYPYPQQYPQAYPQQAYPGYGQPAYGYNQGYAQSPIGSIIDSLLGNRYNVTDRTAVSQCASAAMAQAQAQYRGYGQRGYGQQGYGYQQGIAAPAMRVTAITDVQRRSSGLRVKGLMSSGYGGQYGSQYGGQYGGQYGYQHSGYAGGDLTFRCNVDYRGAVTNIKIASNTSGYRRY